MWWLVAMAAVSAVQSIQARNDGVDAMNSQTDANSMNASAQSKAQGTEALMYQSRSVEQRTKTGRKALQMRGAARASADSAGIGGAGISARVSNIDMQADEAIAVARSDAEAKRQVTEMSSRERYRANKYQSDNYKPATLGEIAMGVGLSTFGAYAGSQMAGGE